MKLLCTFFFVFLFAFSNIIAQNANILNQVTYGGNQADNLTVCIKTSTGYLIGGSSWSSQSGDKTGFTRGYEDFWILNLDNNLDIIWEKTIGGDSTDWLSSMLVTSDGNFLIGGSSKSAVSADKTTAPKGLHDFWLLKLSPSGNEIWQKSYGGDSIDFLNDMIELNDGSFLIAGSSMSNISGDKSENSKGQTDYWIIKIDSLGNLIWDRTIGGNAGDAAQMISYNNHFIYVIGTTLSNMSGDKTENSYGEFDIWMVKMDLQGNVVWDKTLGGASTEFSNGILYLDDFIYLASQSYSDASGTKTEDSNGEYDIWLIKLDTNGTVIWDMSIGGTNHDMPRAIQATSDGNLLVSGFSFSGISGDKTENSNGGSDYWFFVADTSGNILYQKTIGGSDHDQMMASVIVSHNHFLLAGVSYSNISGDKTENSNGDYDYWLVELSIPLSVIETTNPTFTVFPVPTSATLNFTPKSQVDGDVKVSVTDMEGRTLIESYSPVQGSIDVSSISTGTYILSITTEQGTHRQTFVKW